MDTTNEPSRHGAMGTTPTTTEPALQNGAGAPMREPGSDRNGAWPALPYAEWRDTLATVHMGSQIAGKIRLALMPPVKHTWHATLPVTARGFTTGSMPHGSRFFQIDFDLVAHVCRVVVPDGREEEVALRPMAVADFHEAAYSAAADLGTWDRRALEPR
jgi:hypothetical protein